MSLFQILVLILIAVVIGKAIKRFWLKELSLLLFLTWSGVWVALAVVVMLPGILSWVANFMGIGRGVDLVIYLALFAIFYIVFKIYLRINKIEKNMTELIRKIAMQNMRKTETDKDKKI